MITIISGTNRQGSNTLKLSKYYQKQLAKRGVESYILSLTDLPDSLISSDLYGKRSVDFQKIQDLINATNKFVFVIPEYNGSFPGVLKTFIDACNFPDSFHGKKAALVGLSSGKYGNVRGVEHFTGICHYIHLNVMSLKIHIPAIQTELNEAGELWKDDTVKFTDQQIDRLVEF
ncbi:MAG: NADPH-dependent FMN reductase [Sphingobacteriaceae bacterium]